MTASLLAAIQPVIQAWPFFAYIALIYTVVGAALILRMSRVFPKRHFVAFALLFIAVVGGGNAVAGAMSHEALTGAIIGATIGLLFGLTFPIGLLRGKRRANAKYLLAHANAQQATAQFDRLKQPGSELITAASLEAVLMQADTTDGERRFIGWLSANIREVGHKVGEYKSFSVSIDRVVEKKVEYFAISRDDLAGSEERLIANSGGWLRVAAA